MKVNLLIEVWIEEKELITQFYDFLNFIKGLLIDGMSAIQTSYQLPQYLE
jgi:hypothetical protein